jgi:hypothetical protein
MPSFKIRPKALSMHGRQLCIEHHTGKTVFSVAKISRLQTLSLRHNLEVCVGDSSEEVRSNFRSTPGTGFHTQILITQPVFCRQPASTLSFTCVCNLADNSSCMYKPRAGLLIGATGQQCSSVEVAISRIFFHIFNGTDA